ncbi:MAG TPA: ABC transporter permease [Bacillota bacterium]|nr:ABC transporter permease [Bacillota bacterium]
MDRLSKGSIGSGLKQIALRQEFSSILMLIIMFVITAILQENFFEHNAVVRNINAFAPLILLAMGQAVVIVAGGLDLSAGAALSLMTCILTFVMKSDSSITGVYAIVVTFIAAVLMGVINGIGIGYLRIPPVIITFATSYIWLGVALFIRPTPGGQSVEWFQIFYNTGSAESLPGFVKAIGTVIQPALVLVLIGCLIWYIISKTKTGRYIYAVGSSGDSAYATGINTAKVQMMACIINSIFIFLAALFFVGQNQSGDARMGDPMTLRCIAAAVVGGIALSGGKGSIYLALVGALILSFVNKIIFFANIPNAYQTLVSGLIIIIAISVSMVYSHINKKAMLKEGN